MAYCIAWSQARLSAQVQNALLQAEGDSARLEKALSKADTTFFEEANARTRLEAELEEVQLQACGWRSNGTPLMAGPFV